jgi:enamine deaminase RidA (YjgF/YER057c/UK114 family)
MIDDKLKSLGLELPPAPKPIGLYKPMLVIGDLVYVSGHGPLKSDRTLITGRLGSKQADGLTLEQGQMAAKQTGLAILATLKAGLGSLDRIARVVKLLGLVRCTDDFDQQPAVINGCSQLFVDLWGDDLGIGVRSALGTNALPGGIAVEIEAIFEIRG